MNSLKYSEILDRLKKIKNVKTDNELAVLLGVAPNTITTWRGRNTGDLEKIIAICDDESLLAYVLLGVDQSKTVAISKNDHISGKSLKVQTRTLIINTDIKNNEIIQFVPSTAFAGYLTGFSDPEYVEHLPTVSISGMLPPGTYRAFEVKGDSMEGTYRPGDRLICRYMDDWQKMKQMKAYVIVNNDDIVVKRVENRLKAEGIIICHSDNKFYPPYEMDFSEISEVWSVEAFIRVGDTTPKTDIDALRAEIVELRKKLP
jgi:hypothetical protein